MRLSKILKACMMMPRSCQACCCSFRGRRETSAAQSGICGPGLHLLEEGVQRASHGRLRLMEHRRAAFVDRLRKLGSSGWKLLDGARAQRIRDVVERQSSHRAGAIEHEAHPIVGKAERPGDVEEMAC